MSPREPRLDFERLYRSHRQELYRVALRKLGDHHDAEDVTQATFLDAYSAVLRGAEPDLPRAWLHAIAENVRRRRFRASLRRPREEPLRESHAVDDVVDLSADEIRAALATLAESQRKAFLLRELGGLSYDEIAAELGTTVAAVQMLIFRARQKLRRELEGPVLGRLGGLLPAPHWLSTLADRLVPSGSGAARVVGLAAAGAVAVGGGVTTDAPATAPGRAGAAEPAVAVVRVTPPSPRSAVAVAGAAAPSRAPAPARMTAVPTRRQPPDTAAAPTRPPAPAVEPAPAPVVEAGPATPVAPPATAEEGGQGPTPVPPLGRLPLEAPAPPPPPALPVEGAVPALPELPVVGEPPPLPAPPSAPAITIPELPVPPPVP